MIRFTRSFVLIAIVLGSALLAGCQGGTTSIKTLLDDPGRFDNQTVRVAGNVTHAVGVLGYGAYQLNDGTGTITVVSKAEGAPREGAKVGVEGQFKSAFTLGTETAAVIMEAQRFTP
jgi:uncharacterized protein YdeI (BOF family)